MQTAVPCFTTSAIATIGRITTSSMPAWKRSDVIPEWSPSLVTVCPIAVLCSSPSGDHCSHCRPYRLLPRFAGYRSRVFIRPEFSGVRLMAVIADSLLNFFYARRRPIKKLPLELETAASSRGRDAQRQNGGPYGAKSMKLATENRARSAPSIRPWSRTCARSGHRRSRSGSGISFGPGYSESGHSTAIRLL